MGVLRVKKEVGKRWPEKRVSGGKRKGLLSREMTSSAIEAENQAAPKTERDSFEVKREGGERTGSNWGRLKATRSGTRATGKLLCRIQKGEKGASRETRIGPYRGSFPGRSRRPLNPVVEMIK